MRRRVLLKKRREGFLGGLCALQWQINEKSQQPAAAGTTECEVWTG